MLISIALSTVFIASSNLFKLPRALPLLIQASEYCGLIQLRILSIK
jgi:hypothetical protein